MNNQEKKLGFLDWGKNMEMLNYKEEKLIKKSILFLIANESIVGNRKKA